MLQGPVLFKEVVVQYGDRTIKGHTDSRAWLTAPFLDGVSTSPPIQLVGSETSTTISLEGAKAVFFVKSLEGTSRDDLRFHDHLQPLPCLWIRVTFLDGEVIEGIIRNDSCFAFKPRFVMASVDPEGNNLVMLVLRDQLRNFQVLGLRNAPKKLAAIFNIPASTDL